MFLSHLIPLIIPPLLSAGCSALPSALDRPMLNSARIAARYGSYGVELLARSSGERYSCLYSERQGVRTSRTLAIVLFAATAETLWPQAMAEIRAGASLGAMLQSSGWRVDKHNRHIGRLAFDPAMLPAIADLFHLRRRAELALHVYDLEAVQGGRSAAVATLIELHHPDYLGFHALRRIYVRLPWSPSAAPQREHWREQVAGFPGRP